MNRTLSPQPAGCGSCAPSAQARGPLLVIPMEALSAQSAAAVNQVSQLAKVNPLSSPAAGAPRTHVMVDPVSGTTLSSVVTTPSVGGEGRIEVTGAVLGVPIVAVLHVKLDPNPRTLTVKLELLKPLPLSYTWVYQFGGATGPTTSGASAVLDPHLSGAQGAISGGLLCVLQCVGLGLLALVKECLAQLGDWDAFMRCLVEKLGADDAASVGVCLWKCFQSS